MPAAIPDGEGARLEALATLKILDTNPEQEFDAIVKLAAEICGTPIALISFVDETRQWFKARLGVDVRETPRDLAYCAHTILEDRTLVVPNAALDPRFADNPGRTAPPGAEFYAGVPLKTSTGHNVGTLCVVDHVPRALSAAQQTALEALAVQVVRLLELRRAGLLQRDSLAERRADDDALRSGEPSEGLARTRSWSRIALALAGVLGVASLVASLRAHVTIRRAGADRLARAGERASAFLEARGQAYGAILRGVGALFRASEHVTPSEFAAYAAALDPAQNFSGILGLGYSERVPRAALARWLAETRSEVPDLRVNSSGTASDLIVNKYIEPRSVNRAAIGFDVASDPVRLRALNAAAQSKSLALSHRVRLLQDPDHGPGFVLYLPVPSHGPDVADEVSWVFAALRARDLVAGIERAAGADVELTLTDEPPLPPLLGKPTSSAGLLYLDEVVLADRRFTLAARPGPSFFSLSDRTEPWAILLLGLAATGLTFALTRSMRRTEKRSHTLAVRMTDALRRGERELRAVIEGTTDLIITFGSDGRLLLTNHAFRQVLGYTPEELAAMTVGDVVHPDARAAFDAALARAPAAPGSQRIETSFRASSGATIEVDGALAFFLEDERRVTRAIFRDVSSRRQAERALLAANQALQRLATTDSLTGVANRRLFDERLAEETARARRSGSPLTIALGDVDCFKQYNDHYGHPQGDECLRQLGGCLRATARRAGELTARYGGEEFAILLPGSDEDSALHLIDQLRRRIAALALVHERNPHGMVTASFGVASFDPTTMSGSEDLLAAADSALYRAKSAGRNRVERASLSPCGPT